MPLCRFCLKPFVRESSTPCFYHPGLFVCRYHPNSAKASGDGLGYYGSPDHEGWEARFWDCCGSEDPDARGCASQSHASFDDKVDDDLYMLRRDHNGCIVVPTMTLSPKES